ncbi:MAG: hypothetical protein U0271_21130 [Polyangiaceae bacterium]
MAATSRRRALGVIVQALGVALLPACDPLLCDCIPAPAKLGSFPYHPLVFHLDLAILAYQLHCQSLVWPFDPFYEDRSNGIGLDRAEFMQRVREWMKGQAAAQAGVTTLDAYRGPGALGGFPNNKSHDPILYNYSLIHPWSDAIMDASGEWTEYLTPRLITGRIAEVYVSYRQNGGEETDVLVEAVPLRRDDADPDAADVLIAFEGGTGDKGEPGQPASQSLMGFVLLRHTGSGYDVHVSFRGSRSGSAVRAVAGALSTQSAYGNPDWITDLGFRFVSAADGVGDITETGAVARGFSRSMQSMLPAVFLALSKVAELKNGEAPTNIYVTGHSLGGALAQHFASAVLLGGEFGPGGAGEGMPASLVDWPWTELKLMTFGAPRAGELQWAEALTNRLESTFFYEDPIVSFDQNARYVTDPEIVDRLLDAEHPAAFRVLISTDPISIDAAGGGSHVGQTVYVNGDLLTDWFGLPTFSSHEPELIRQYMTDAMADERTPERAWRYRPLKELAPDRDDSRAGSREEFEKLAAAVVDYYADRDQWFDADALDRNLALMFTISG